MLSDRPYMRDGYQRERTSFVVWLISALVAGFIVQFGFSSLLHTGGFARWAQLSSAALQQLDVWTLLTYPFVHRGPLHLLGLVLAIFFVGRELSPHLGERRLLWLAVLSVVAGALGWFGFHFDDASTLVGASPILWCYFAVFASLFPNREISFLVFFVLPVTTRPKYIAGGLVVIDIVGALFFELQPERNAAYPIPHSAHLAAMLVGWLYFRYVHEAPWLALRPRAEIELPRWIKSPRPAALPPPAEEDEPNTPPAGTREDIRVEVDRVLDKINSHGFSSLTLRERQVLDDAKALLSKR